MANGNEGSTPALGDVQARKLLEAPPAGTLKGIRDRAILATLLYHGTCIAFSSPVVCTLPINGSKTIGEIAIGLKKSNSENWFFFR